MEGSAEFVVVLLKIGDEQPLANGNFRKDAVDEMRRIEIDTMITPDILLRWHR